MHGRGMHRLKGLTGPVRQRDLSFRPHMHIRFKTLRFGGMEPCRRGERQTAYHTVRLQDQVSRVHVEPGGHRRAEMIPRAATLLRPK